MVRQHFLVASRCGRGPWVSGLLLFEREIVKNRISVEEAWDAIAARLPILNSEKRPLSDALGQRTAADILSSIALPPFHNSAVDGYALSSLEQDFDVVSTIGAGECFGAKLQHLDEQAR